MKRALLAVFKFIVFVVVQSFLLLFMLGLGLVDRNLLSRCPQCKSFFSLREEDISSSNLEFPEVLDRGLTEQVERRCWVCKKCGKRVE